MRQKSREDESGPATLGTTAKAHLLLRVWCRHSADLAVPRVAIIEFAEWPDHKIQWPQRGQRTGSTPSLNTSRQMIQR